MTEPVDCAGVQARVHEFLDGELDERQADELRRHLVACEHCLDEADLIDAVKKLVRRSCSCETAPASLRLRIVTQLQQVTHVRLEHGDRPA